ncbi:MAG: 50S ribosomal protein L21 [Lentisphaerae bacterium]|nr:50S ribosomal protein L21 [Lentisphaerota bacterium]
MQPYAVVQTGGKQYRVQPNDVLRVEKLDAKAGEQIALEPVLAVSDGQTLTVGTPNVENAKVLFSVVEHRRAPKVTVFKKKRRKGYTRKQGHRQAQTVLKVESIG